MVAQPSAGAMAEWLCSGLQIRVPRFDSELRLQISCGVPEIYNFSLLRKYQVASQSTISARRRAGFFIGTVAAPSHYFPESAGALLWGWHPPEPRNRSR